jgi:hypothetical protein
MNNQFSLFILQAALTTAPDLMQLVQTINFLTLPLEITRTL